MYHQASLSPSPGDRERLARPGIVLRRAGSHSSFKEHENFLLETKLEVKVGENKVQKIDFSADGLQAYVELVDEAGE